MWSIHLIQRPMLAGDSLSARPFTYTDARDSTAVASAGESQGLLRGLTDSALPTLSLSKDARMGGYVDINADIGEGAPDVSGLLALVTSVTVACDGQGGSQSATRAACADAVRRGVTLGALVGYQDRRHPGLTLRDVDPVILRQQVADQVGMLAEAARAEGGFVTYLKAYGALYHHTAADALHAAAVLEGSGQLPVLGTAGSLLLRMAAESGRGIRHEGFPDRGYTSDGGLLPRDQPGAVLEDTADMVQRALTLAPSLDSLCVHGESSNAVLVASAVRAALVEHGWTIRSCWLSSGGSK